MIKRHKIDQSASLEIVDLYREKIPIALNRLLDGKSINFSSYKRIAMEMIVQSLVSEPSKELIYTCLRYFLDLGIAHLEYTYTNEEQIDIILCGKTYNIPVEKSRQNIDANTFIILFSVAFILKNKDKQQQLIDLLENIPEDDKFLIAWGKYLTALFYGNNEVRLKMLQILNQEAQTDEGVFIGIAGNKRTFVDGRSESLIRISLPWMHLYELVLAKNELKFNARLSNYLIDKKEYITKKRWRDNTEYWIDILTLACCSFANEKGINIEVESEYIPSWLYKEDLTKFKLLF